MTEVTANPRVVSAAEVANTFLDLQSRDSSDFPRIDHMKLQKLLFYSQAWWLAQMPNELFNEDIEAWPWGPVVRDIYLQFKDCGGDPIIGKRAKMLGKASPHSSEYTLIEAPPISDDTVRGYLADVWEKHKSSTGIQLSNATHEPGEPWTIVKERYGSLNGKPTIPTVLIKDVFRSKLVSE